MGRGVPPGPPLVSAVMNLQQQGICERDPPALHVPNAHVRRDSGRVTMDEAFTCTDCNIASLRGEQQHKLLARTPVSC